MRIKGPGVTGVLVGLLVALPGVGLAQQAPQELGVYEYVLQSATGPIDEIVKAIEAGATERGWRVLATVAAGVPEGCTYKARVLVLFDPAYAQQVMTANPRTGAFAVVDRINVFEDEAGSHVAIVNPRSIDRTILMDDEKFEALSEKRRQALRQLVSERVQGRTSEKQFGPLRSKGYIGRTMGVMAGGPFDGKIETEGLIGGTDWRALAAKIGQGLSGPGGTWGMHKVYEVELPDYKTVIFGTTGTPMDARSFSIVGAGGDASRSSLTCAGLAHAGAYPIEVVVAPEGLSVRAKLVNVMYRMKMYFEDAGKWAFMKNMGMPGSIQDELRGQIRAATGQQM